MLRRTLFKTIVGAVFAPFLISEVKAEPTVDFIKALEAPLKEPVFKASTLREIYISPQALEDIRQWGIYEIDAETAKEIYTGDLA